MITRFRANAALAAVLLSAALPAASFAAATVDVLFAFDSSAQAWLSDVNPGTPVAEAANAVAGCAVDKMNAVLKNTDLDQSYCFSLAGVYLANASAEGSTPQERLEGTLSKVADSRYGKAAAAWADVQNAREAAKADIVVVLVDSGFRPGDGAHASGISWGLGSVKVSKISAFAPFAYSVCAVQEVESSHIVTHEVAHVMGAGHNEAFPDGPQYHSYSAAYYFTDGDGIKRYTIMGYPYRTSEDSGYKPADCFSSASHSWGGVPCGDASHDNTRTLRETCYDVSLFRISGNEGIVIAVPAAFGAKTVVNGLVSDSESKVVGIVQATVAKTDAKGTSKVSASFIGLDGKKKSASGGKFPVALSEGVPTVVAEGMSVKGLPGRLSLSISSDGTISGSFGECAVSGVDSVGVLSPGPATFRLEAPVLAIGGYPALNDVESGGVHYHLQPDSEGVEFSVSGSKWIFSKAFTVKYAKDKKTKTTELKVDPVPGARPNPCGLKLSVSPKTGLFKGSFTVYVDSGTCNKPKIKKCKFNVTGVVVDGKGFGQATCKGLPAAIPVEVEQL